MKTIVFAYARNAARAQTAAALFNQMSNQGLAKAIAAYIAKPAPVPPGFAATMDERALDVATADEPQRLTQQLVERADAVIVTDGFVHLEHLPIGPKEDWSGGAAEAAEVEALDALYEELRPRVWKLIAREGWWKLQPLAGKKSQRGQA